ncbi:Cof-type HAD-IIB family hydrolase [Virgibacillus sp. W0430]|uniref:Cof-type HAD-IIB family hydrolase n=1 Tax=Virgibacillus sp. W0430 TaxID=3391580 RepID=UPI003F4542DB
MSIEAVFFDIDGTLIDENKLTADKTVYAINQLRENGIKVIFATGRSPRHIVDVQKMFGIHSFVCFNGSVGVCEGKRIFQHALNHGSLTRLITDATTKNNPMVFLNERGSYASSEADEQISASFNHLKEDHPEYRPNVWESEEIIQSFLYCSPEEQKMYEEEHEELKFTRWHTYAVDVNNHNMNKSVGIKSYLEYLNINPRNTAAFGDNLNDLEMLSYVGYGIAMGNAVDVAKEKADYVTKPLHENGIYFGLKHMGLI